MFGQYAIDDSTFCYNELTCLEEFLLAHSSSKQAFINLSRMREIIKKEELLDEIKRLIKEQIIRQIRKSKGVSQYL